MAAVDDDFAAIESLEDELFGDDITYARGDNSVPITAVVSEQKREVVDAQGLLVTITSRAYECNAADLVLDGGQVSPQAGDLITETIDGTEFTFETMPLGRETCYEWLDSQHRRIVIHTKRIA